MRLVTDDLPEIDGVTAAQIEQVLSDEAFGNFAVLEAADGTFIQTACMWEPGEETRAFLEATGSDPFRLEYRDEATGRIYAAEGLLTLAQVTQAFIEYLNGQEDWLTRFTWSEVEEY
jgi:hypothetical protein